MNNIGRILGIALIIGGIIVGIILTYLMTTYRNEDLLSTNSMILGLVLGYVLLVLPQFVIGVLLIWKGNDSRGYIN